MPVYPNLPEGIEVRLNAVLVAAGGQGSRYLDDPACPYPANLKAVLRPLLVKERQTTVGVGGDENQFDGLEEGDRFDLLLKEVEQTITSMKQIENDLSVESDSGDRIQLVKAKTGLLEKWVGLKERVYSLKEISEFQRIMMETLDQVLTVDQRADVMARLNDLRSIQKKPMGAESANKNKVEGQ